MYIEQNCCRRLNRQEHAGQFSPRIQLSVGPQRVSVEGSCSQYKDLG
jgi:hypothetical protein